jgi:hypothetical protein
MRANSARFKGDFQLRYGAYSRDHGMTREQMLVYDRRCYPFTLLTPYFHWLSGKRLEWERLNPGRRVESGKEHADFGRWLEQLAPYSNAITCECHVNALRSFS